MQGLHDAVVAFGKLRSLFKVDVTTSDQAFTASGEPGFDELKRVLKAHGIDPEKGGTLQVTGDKAEALKRDLEAALGALPSGAAEPVDLAKPAAPAEPVDPLDRLVRLAQLRREGALSEAEFEDAKRRVLEDL